MRRRRIAPLLIVLGFGAGSACTSLEGLSGSDAGVDAPTDAAPGDDSATIDAGPDTFDATHAPYSSVVLADKPIAYYRLGDMGAVALDIGSAAANGAYGGNVVHGAPSLIANDLDPAARFSGGGNTDAIVRVQPQAALQRTTALTVECWVTITGPQNFARVVSYGEDNVSPFESYVLQYENAKAELYVAPGLLVTGVTALTHGVIYYLAGTFDGVSGKVFVNGILDGLQPTSGGITQYDANPGLGIGGGFSGTGPQHIGTLDEVALYDHALTPERIAAHFAAGR
jgi:hypothetical protein